MGGDGEGCKIAGSVYEPLYALADLAFSFSNVVVSGGLLFRRHRFLPTMPAGRGWSAPAIFRIRTSNAWQRSWMIGQALQGIRR